MRIRHMKATTRAKKGTEGREKGPYKQDLVDGRKKSMRKGERRKTIASPCWMYSGGELMVDPLKGGQNPKSRRRREKDRTRKKIQG